MMKQHLVMSCLVAAICSMVSSCSQSTEGRVSPVVFNQVKMAVEVVEYSLGNMQDGGGYQAWTASKAADKLVRYMNAANEPMPGEPKVPGIGAKIRYVKDEVTAPWQILLTPDDKTSTIKVDGYGRDTSEPLYSVEIHVSKFG